MYYILCYYNTKNTSHKKNETTFLKIYREKNTKIVIEFDVRINGELISKSYTIEDAKDEGSTFNTAEKYPTISHLFLRIIEGENASGESIFDYVIPYLKKCIRANNKHNWIYFDNETPLFNMANSSYEPLIDGMKIASGTIFEIKNYDISDLIKISTMGKETSAITFNNDLNIVAIQTYHLVNNSNEDVRLVKIFPNILETTFNLRGMTLKIFNEDNMDYNKGAYVFNSKGGGVYYLRLENEAYVTINCPFYNFANDTLVLNVNLLYETGKKNLFSVSGVPDNGYSQNFSGFQIDRVYSEFDPRIYNFKITNNENYNRKVILEFESFRGGKYNYDTTYVLLEGYSPPIIVPLDDE